jgi:hypothetical protein
MLPDRVDIRGATAFAETAKAVSVMNRESRVRGVPPRFSLTIPGNLISCSIIVADNDSN